MKDYLIRRDITGVSLMDERELSAAAKTSNAALDQLGPGIRWVSSFVVEDRTYCHYQADSEDIVRRHAEISGFPADDISEIVTTISPATAGIAGGESDGAL